jgi:long-chain acyl-CoA synthetase
VGITNEELAQRVAGRTVCSEFLRSMTDNADRVALREMAGEDAWRELTYGGLAERVAQAAAGLQAAGVGSGDRVVLMMRNTIDYHVIDMAVLFLGATPISIYNSSSPDQVEYLVNHCQAKVAVLEDDGFLQRFAPVRDQLSSLETIFVLNGEPGDGAKAGSTLFDHGSLDLATAAGNATPEDLATVIYTSGTTGRPKGVALSHFNVCWTMECLREELQYEDPEGMRSVSYLPMAHIAERMVSHYLGLTYGMEITACPEPGRVAEFARETKPHILFGVPRVWEKVYAGVQAALSADEEKARQVAEAIEAATPIVEAMTNGTATQEQIDTYEFLDAVAFSTIRGLLGLDELKLAITGAAPMVPHMLTWFRTIGIKMSEVYGMSESTGPITLSAWKPRAGTVGEPCPGVEVKIAEDGEVCFRGGNVFEGYLNDQDKTDEVLDEDGWLHTGDVGEFDEDGYLRIVDRKKELIITAGGKNISPANLEAALKDIPLVGQAAAIGDNRPFVSALVVLDPDQAASWAAKHGMSDRSPVELAKEPAVIDEINAGVERVMAGFNNAERVKKVTVLGEEWLPDSELLTPTSKLKRRGVNSKFAEEIEAMYA